MSYYKDIRENMRALEERGKLVRIKSQVNKDTEIMPLVRLQYLGLPEEMRRAFFFDNVVDSRGIRYKSPVLVGALGASAQVYAIGMMCKPEELMEKRIQAELHPLEPKLVERGAVQEEVHIGDTLMEHGALDEFPVPISTPGFDAAPCFSAPYWITRDPDDGIRNTGTYRAMPKSPTRTGIDFANMSKGGAIHWLKCRDRGIPLPAAIVIGGPPSVGYASVTRYPTGVDELKVAGGIAGEPLEVVKCKTVDLEVPAWSEIVIEGEINTQELEPEGAFGEAIGFMCMPQPRPYFTVKCITHRKNPVWLAFLNEFQPSEGSKIKQFSLGATVYKHLRYDLKMEYVKQVSFPETTDAKMMVVQVGRTAQDNVWRTLEAAAKYHQQSKIVVAVDDFVNPADLDMVCWALVHCSQAHRDYRTVMGTAHALADCSLAPMEILETLRTQRSPKMPESSKLLMNGTIKWPYPPISLPGKPYMERAMEIWQKEGLPTLKLRPPVWGEDLGFWSAEDKEKAERAVKGEYYKTGEIQAGQRQRT